MGSEEKKDDNNPLLPRLVLQRLESFFKNNKGFINAKKNYEEQTDKTKQLKSRILKFAQDNRSLNKIFQKVIDAFTEFEPKYSKLKIRDSEAIKQVFDFYYAPDDVNSLLLIALFRHLQGNYLTVDGVSSRMLCQLKIIKSVLPNLEIIIYNKKGENIYNNTPPKSTDQKGVLEKIKNFFNKIINFFVKAKKVLSEPLTYYRVRKLEKHIAKHTISDSNYSPPPPCPHANHHNGSSHSNPNQNPVSGSYLQL